MLFCPHAKTKYGKVFEFRDSTKVYVRVMKNQTFGGEKTITYKILSYGSRISFLENKMELGPRPLWKFSMNNSESKKNKTIYWKEFYAVNNLYINKRQQQHSDDAE